mgnify:CR=1 FL=1
MADIRCSRCGEPWDIDCLHDEIEHRNPSKPWKTENGSYLDGVYEKLFSAMRKEFRLKGCAALTSYTDVKCTPVPNAGIFGELMDIAGDDIDFAAGMMEDAERWGLV